jgi:uncharacterized membrane protein (DUF485 family)
MLFWTEPTQEEKIDYVYKTLRSEKRNRMLKYIVFIFVISYAYFNIWAALVSGDTIKIKAAIQEQIMEMVVPIVQEASKSALQNTQIHKNNKNSSEDMATLRAEALQKNH